MAQSEKSPNGGMKLILGLVVAAVIAGAGYYFYSKQENEKSADKTGETVKLAENVMGSADAPITLLNILL